LTRQPEKHRPFWDRKIKAMKQQGIIVFTRNLRYYSQTAPSGPVYLRQEKGIDVRIAIDIISTAISARCNVILLFSQDQDFSEVAGEIRAIAKQRQRNRWLKIASAYPYEPAPSCLSLVPPKSSNIRGVNETDWIRISRPEYDSCLDPAQY
jgi:hypothetical protein